MKLRQLRQALSLNQKQFWAALGLVQSAGSRYETGDRRLPAPTRKLIKLVLHGTKKTILERLRQVQEL